MLEITEEQLAEWMALCDAATPGPWTRSGLFEALNRARTAMPALIAALREARAGLAELECARRVALAMLEAEQAKVKRLRWALKPFAECSIDNGDIVWRQEWEAAARVLKETE